MVGKNLTKPQQVLKSFDRKSWKKVWHGFLDKVWEEKARPKVLTALKKYLGKNLAKKVFNKSSQEFDQKFWLKGFLRKVSRKFWQR